MLNIHLERLRFGWERFHFFSEENKMYKLKLICIQLVITLKDF